MSTRDLLLSKDTNRLNVKWWKKIFHPNSNQKRTGLAIIISEKIDFKSKKLIKDKEEHYILVKISIQQKDIIITNIYQPNNRPSKYIKQKLSELKGEIDHSTVIVGDINIPLSIMDRITR